ncbi:MAG: hypothetical protein ACFB50_13075 [Rubrobacteraceae bacterium]
MAKEEIAVEDIAPGLIVRHSNRRIGRLTRCEACERLISGSISFSEFVDQVGEGYRELLDFMMDHDLHPGRPEEVVYCIESYGSQQQRALLRAQLQKLYLWAQSPEAVDQSYAEEIEYLP